MSNGYNERNGSASRYQPDDFKRDTAISPARSRGTVTGLNLRNRAARALEAAATSLRDEQAAGSVASSSTQTGVRQSRQNSTLAPRSTTADTSTPSGTIPKSALLTSKAYQKRSILADLRNRSRQQSYSSSISIEDRELQFKKHNLPALPPPGHIRPVLLPTYAVKTPKNEIKIRVDGFVEVWPKSRGTSQRVFNQMVRQMAALPRLPRQQPSPASMTPTDSPEEDTAHHSAWITGPSTSMPSSPLHEDTDDALFFPGVPYGHRLKTDKTGVQHHVLAEGIPERITQHAFALGAPEKAIGKVLQTVGALPLEGELDSELEKKTLEEEEEQVRFELEKLRSSPETTQTSRDSPFGGAAVWADRSREDVERLWHTLEHRLRTFWTYRKPHQLVLIEVIPVFRGEQFQEDQDWSLDEYKESSARDPTNLAPLIAMTKLTSDANGLFTTELTLTDAKINHYLAHYHASNPKKSEDLMYLRVRACMLLDGNDMIRSQWQSLRITPDDHGCVRIICDVDDTSKHTEVLAGSRTVTRNVFVRPFEEVRIAGVTHWFDRLCFEAKVDGFHFVTNAPAEMYSIVKSYLSTAQLPSGHLALKHYFSPAKTASWLQAFMQPASSRKRQNLQRCLDDFPNSRFIFIGDSGEMDLEIYSELSKERPNQVKGIWIRDVGNVTTAAKSMVSGSFAQSKSASSIQPPPAAHLQSNNSYPPKGQSKSAQVGLNAKTLAKHPAEAIRKGSLNVANSPVDEYEARLGRALAIIPPTTIFRFWNTGQDAMDESVQYIKELKHASSNNVS